MNIHTIDNMNQTPVTMESIAILIHNELLASEARMDDKFRSFGTQINTHVDNKLRQHANQMDGRLCRIELSVEAMQRDIADIKTTLQSHDNKIDFIIRSVNLGECKKKSFWRDGWTLSNIALPIVCAVAAWVGTIVAYYM